MPLADGHTVAENTGSLLTSEVKRYRARLVLGWGTAWEDLRVLSAFSVDVVALLHTPIHSWRHRGVATPEAAMGCYLSSAIV